MRRTTTRLTLKRVYTHRNTLHPTPPPPHTHTHAHVRTLATPFTWLTRPFYVQMPHLFAQPVPGDMRKNTHGYTFIVSGRSTAPVPASPYALRTLCHPELAWEAGRTLAATRPRKEVHGFVRPIKHDIILRVGLAAGHAFARVRP